MLICFAYFFFDVIEIKIYKQVVLYMFCWNMLLLQKTRVFAGMICYSCKLKTNLFAGMVCYSCS